ncbi:MAG TPA: thioredoxin domain-containing protein, partial [Chloroflexota bacterium]|nr:thioredoxin domain-containing protein [Chloroflexota bacterium]
MPPSNRLIHETSPYLRQHAHNPVDWYPWGDEAIQKARAEKKPILLSIGYAACHWCHVMERESFEDPQTAQVMNRFFVPIKVDREERPDLDSIYMEIVQAMTGSGGWPMTVFLTPDLVPFYAGTYFPPVDRHGLPSFQRVMLSLADAWTNRPADLAQTVDQVRDFLGGRKIRPAPDAVLGTEILDRAAAQVQASFDSVNGGFGRAPKFPQPMILEFLLRQYHRTGDTTALTVAQRTLQRMARGGMYDQVGGGFHRYAVDAVWLVPHFEKMLYDNAQLAAVYLDAYQVTGNRFYRRIAEETLDYVQREMTSPEGGFYSSQDADSEGEEGKFYVWSLEEIRKALDPLDARIVELSYGVTEAGNFEGKNILYLAREPEQVGTMVGLPADEVAQRLAAARVHLYTVRSERVWPGRDEKILTAWNGLMIRAFARGARILGRDDYRQTAERAAGFVLGSLAKDGRLLRSYKDNIAKLNGYLEDYAFLADGLLALYEATFDPRWFREARQLTDSMVTWFWDAGGGFYDTSTDHEALITRPRDLTDNATPAGNSLAAAVLVRLGSYTGDESLRERARSIFAPLAEAMAEQPLAFGRLLCALDQSLAPPREVAIVGEPDAVDTRALIEVIDEAYRPNLAVALKRPGDTLAEQAIPLLQDRTARDGKATAYVCQA